MTATVTVTTLMSMVTVVMTMTVVTLVTFTAVYFLLSGGNFDNLDNK